MSQENVLSEIISGLKSTHGEEFFNTICLQLDQVIGADFTFIARLNHAKWTSRTIALVANGEIAENFEYELDHTPCADVADDSCCVYPSGICDLYPKDQLLVDMKIDGYIGAPLHSSKGEVMGIVVALYQKPIKNPEFIQHLFELFSGRISAEVERSEREADLQHLNESLEDKVTERTQELSDALANLKKTQDQMIEQERLASLGSLVAGVAHEINTPLGVALLSGSNITDLAYNVKAKMDEQTLSKQDLESTISDILESGESLMHNLQRAADLVSNFKQVAAERNTNDLNCFDFCAWLETQLSSLRPLLRKHKIEVKTQLPQNSSINLYTYGAKLSQVIVNLASNSAKHAFPEEFECVSPQITISAEKLDDKLKLIVEDNGIGISAEHLPQVFEPFFTTKRNLGGTGLGLSIVNNIVKSALEGDLSLESSENKGTKVTITLPLTINS